MTADGFEKWWVSVEHAEPNDFTDENGVVRLIGTRAVCRYTWQAAQKVAYERAANICADSITREGAGLICNKTPYDLAYEIRALAEKESL